MCELSPSMNIGAIAETHKSISGTLTTTNVIMAFWSREMWQSVVGQSNGNISIGPVRTVLLHGICDRHLKCSRKYQITLIEVFTDCLDAILPTLRQNQFRT
ncbi:hypothetical protein KIN20_030223 [Parelaphostrongylus tenuis]|uniref:Uncharacterized protein n=1 Tax=Parelaphostrongylus tenuis TaxID=148309 RepID=A0AAD5WG49_PARTN|nr:hypothetical protein KIN20_030223 [Parelaphostrongylus tenuis]